MKKLSRRAMLQLLAAGTCATRVSAADAARPVATSELPVLRRRVLIPAPGATLPALLVRPAAPGRFPASILPPAAARDEQQLLRAAAQGHVLLAPLVAGLREADHVAVLQYLRRHSAVACRR